ncbi:MAG TPA: Holliday junction resolvase [Thermoplasmata archaeon]|nr:Holliday junction resolvase [Thermoplasmata archaeon]
MPPTKPRNVVGHSSSAYEREFRSLLEGQPDAVRAYARSLPPAERTEFERLVDYPFLIIRAAGSFGFDLVAMRREFSLPIEVKASSEPVIRFSASSGRANAQLDAHRKAVERVGLSVLYAYRRVGVRSEERWRVFGAGALPNTGILRLICKRLPPVSQTPEGNGILRWEEGKPLSRFLYEARYLTEREGRSDE